MGGISFELIYCYQTDRVFVYVAVLPAQQSWSLPLLSEHEILETTEHQHVYDMNSNMVQ